MPKITHIGKYVGVAWAVIGLTLLFTSAIFRLLPHAIEALHSDLSFVNWIILLLWCGFMVFSEGYSGFQKQFSPRFASRALYLFNNPLPMHIVLAPLFCVGYIHATKKRMLTAWLVSLGIVLLVLVVRHVPQPWRGIIDTGVILGLTYGLLSVYSSCNRVMKTKKYATNPEVF